MLKPSFIALCMVALSPLVLSCSSTSYKEDILCPTVRIEKATASATYFKEGKSKGLIDKVFSVKIMGYKGTCSYDKDHPSTVNMSINVEFEAELGAAAMSREQSAKYFVAIPEFYPAAFAKQVFPVRFAFPERYDRIDYRDEEVNISIPIPEGKTATDYTVYIGMQLDKDMLKYNRTLK
jgi:hypothetical protein